MRWDLPNNVIFRTLKLDHKVSLQNFSFLFSSFDLQMYKNENVSTWIKMVFSLIINDFPIKAHGTCHCHSNWHTYKL